MNKLSKEEVLELVKKIRLGQGDDNEVSCWIDKISYSVPNTAIVETIMSGDVLSDEEIVEKLYTSHIIYLNP